MATAIKIGPCLCFSALPDFATAGHTPPIEAPSAPLTKALSAIPNRARLKPPAAFAQIRKSNQRRSEVAQSASECPTPVVPNRARNRCVPSTMQR